MNIQRLLLFVLLINVYSCGDASKKVVPSTSETYDIRFNNLKKIPEVAHFLNAHSEAQIILLQNEGCTPCNEEKLLFLKDSLLKVQSERLIVISSSKSDREDAVYQLFKEHFKVIKVDSDRMMRLGLCLRQYYIIKFEKTRMLSWRIFDRI
jgi:hypothetical protein